MVLVVLVSAFVAVAPVPFELGPAWAEFSREPAGRSTKTEIEVGTLGYDHARGQLDFWFRRTVTSGIKNEETVTWTDTRTCSAARPLLASIRDIPVPKFAPVGSSKGPPVMLDGVSYSLRTYSNQGLLTEQTNVGTPLATWVDAAVGILSQCWSTRVPQRTR
ncbi:MAG TPA: hypothetical protein VFW39_08180 [Sphingomicrobium sp.]|nr:hypothetical protein [Sphingomicrobium sp.]